LARVAVGAALLLGVTVVSATGSPRAGAVVTTVGGACGFHLGTPLVSGALGSLGFEFPAFPADPHQVCSVTVSGTATLGPVSGPAFTNVSGNGGTASFTIDFTGGPLPPAIVWLWSPHCADPPAPTVITLTIEGQSAASAVQDAESCAPDLGGSSSLSFNAVDPSFLWYGVGLASTPDNIGYWGVTAAGDIHGVGDAVTPTSQPISVAPVVGIAADPRGGEWEVAADGGVFALDGAPFFGSLGGVTLNAPVVGMTPTPDGGGYWLVAADGGVFAFGDAPFRGSMGGKPLNAPMVGIAAADAGGYWLVAADGGVFAFGDAPFRGSMGGRPLNSPMVGIATSDAGGYWLAGYDGGVFSFGDAPFEGSAGALDLVAPVFAISPSPAGGGYRLFAGDGGVFTYGNAGFFGPVPVP
jgi:hypothetical protein